MHKRGQDGWSPKSVSHELLWNGSSSLLHDSSMDVMVFHMPSGHIQIEVVTEAALAEIVTVASKGQWNAKTLPSPIYIPVGNKRCPGRDGINPNGTFHTHVWTPKRA